MAETIFHKPLDQEVASINAHLESKQDTLYMGYDNTNTINFNTLTTGWIACTKTQNAPTTGNLGWLCFTLEASPSYAFQFAIGYDPQSAYTRRKWGEWGSWQKITP